jgi:DNA processing protein
LSRSQYTHENPDQCLPIFPTPEELRYWLALLYAPGVGPVLYQRILAANIRPEQLIENPIGDVLGKDIKLSDGIQTYLKRPDWDRIDKDLVWASKPDCHIVSLNDYRYPLLLKEIPDPPPLLFVRGKIEVLSLPQIAIVGSRNPSAGGIQIAREYSRQLAQMGLTITSGMALGIDAASHEGALQEGFTLAVAGTGPDRIYPSRHRELAHRIVAQGAIVSEFPLGTPPLASNFPRRNRIISGLGLGTLVVEAAVKSGSLITARLAAEQGREVFAIPGSIHNPLSRGCHAMIRQGAKLVENIADILEELGPLASLALEALPLTMASTHQKISGNDCIGNPVIEKMGFEPTSIDVLVEQCGLTPEEVSSMLLSLELQGRVTSTGGLYSRNDQGFITNPKSRCP